jgi:hypothetical protein
VAKLEDEATHHSAKTTRENPNESGFRVIEGLAAPGVTDMLGSLYATTPDLLRPASPQRHTETSAGARGVGM